MKESTASLKCYIYMHKSLYCYKLLTCITSTIIPGPTLELLAKILGSSPAATRSQSPQALFSVLCYTYSTGEGSEGPEREDATGVAGFFFVIHTACDKMEAM